MKDKQWKTIRVPQFNIPQPPAIGQPKDLFAYQDCLLILTFARG